MNAPPRLLHQAYRSTVVVQASVPPSHPSTAVLGRERASSGVVLRPDGLVLTVQYVVLGASEVEVVGPDGEVIEARVVAQDFHGGLALLEPARTPAAGLEPGTLGDVGRGDEIFVVAVTGEGDRRVSDGIVMALDGFTANWEFALDAAIATSARNPGLGGAPLVDRRGCVVGISFLDLGEVGRFTLAIPAELYSAHRQELLEHGRRVARPPRAWAGFFCYTLRRHVVFAGVLPGTPAEQGGLKAGDVLISVDGDRITNQSELYQSLWAVPPGNERVFRVFRSDETTEVVVVPTLAEDFFG